MVLDAEIFWADADQNLGRFPLYDPLDDDAIEFFRRRFLFDTFGGTFGTNVPLKYDERVFALRSGMQRAVTARSTEIVDDLTMLRLGVRHRVQTKRGMPGQERIIDWITFDVEGAGNKRTFHPPFGSHSNLCCSRAIDLRRSNPFSRLASVSMSIGIDTSLDRSLRPAKRRFRCAPVKKSLTSKQSYK